jgi:hypothetical protein
MVSRSAKLKVGKVRPGIESESFAARKAPELAIPVLVAALFDKPARVLVGNDRLCSEPWCTEDAYRVVMRKHHMAHGLVCVLAQDLEPLQGGDRRGQGVETDEEVLALDCTDVRVAIGRERVNAVRQDFKRLLLVLYVGYRSKSLR